MGVGGLGSPAALYLAAAGVGTIGLADADDVELSNLHRQVLHGATTLGLSKLESARRRIADLNSDVAVVCHETLLTEANAPGIIRDYDVVIDGSDNFATRYLVNDACAALGIPNVYGAVDQFDGQVAVFHPRAGGPCYRCLFPDPPPDGLVPTCAQAGVLGVLPGIVGVMQATEAVKLILGIGQSLAGRLFLIDALGADTRVIPFERSPDCPTCGGVGLAHPAESSSPPPGPSRCSATAAPIAPVADISAPALRRAIQRAESFVLVDVRELPSPCDAGLIEGAVHIPLARMLDPHADLALDPDAVIITYCATGRQSEWACRLLRDRGFPHVLNLRGGLCEWMVADEPFPD